MQKNNKKNMLKRKLEEVSSDQEEDSIVRLSKLKKKVLNKVAIIEVFCNVKEHIRTMFPGYGEYWEKFDALEEEPSLENFDEFARVYHAQARYQADEHHKEDVERRAILMPYGLFYACFVIMRDAYMSRKITYLDFKICREFVLNSSQQFSFRQPYMYTYYMESAFEASEDPENLNRAMDRNHEYITVIPSLISMFTPKVTARQPVGLAASADYRKLLESVGNLLGSVASGDLLDLNTNPILGIY